MDWGADCRPCLDLDIVFHVEVVGPRVPPACAQVYSCRLEMRLARSRSYTVLLEVYPCARAYVNPTRSVKGPLLRAATPTCRTVRRY